MCKAPYAPLKTCSLRRNDGDVSKLLAAFGAWLALLMTQSATAETFRCGSKIVTKAITVAELVRLCGQPREKTVTEVEPRSTTLYGNSRVLPKIKTEIWIYDRGSQSFGMRVTILDGKIMRMEAIK